MQEAVKNVEAYLKRHGDKLASKAGVPMKTGYRPEMYATDDLKPINSAYYQFLIRILR